MSEHWSWAKSSRFGRFRVKRINIFSALPLATDSANYHLTHIVLNSCGHMHHSLCQAKAKRRGVTMRVTCQQLGHDQASDIFTPVPS